LKNSVTTRAIKQPKGLSRDADKWWRELREEYDITDPGGLLLLATAMQAFDRMNAAKTILDRDGMTMADRFGQPKPHTATVVERDCRSGMLAALSKLNLDIEPMRDRPGRPSGSR
jgi:phage terminase small subunit